MPLPSPCITCRATVHLSCRGGDEVQPPPVPSPPSMSVASSSPILKLKHQCCPPSHHCWPSDHPPPWPSASMKGCHYLASLQHSSSPPPLPLFEPPAPLSPVSFNHRCPSSLPTHYTAVTEPPSKRGVCLPRTYWGILDKVRICKHNTYKHVIPQMKSKLKLLHIKCHVLEFTKDETKYCFTRHLRVLRKHLSLTVSTHSSP
jgi:hypothetical protein